MAGPDLAAVVTGDRAEALAELERLYAGVPDLFAHLTEWGTINLAEVEQARQRYDSAPQQGPR